MKKLFLRTVFVMTIGVLVMLIPHIPAPLRPNDSTITAFAFVMGVAVTSMCFIFFVPDGVDIWDRQRRLMKASGQKRPPTLEINKGTFLYVALIFEELAETLDPVIETLQASHRSVIVKNNHDDVEHRIAHDVLRQLQAAQAQADVASQRLRTTIENLSGAYALDFLDLERAIKFCDGVTDVAVVVAGLAEASGAPGAACYAEITDSNISKADPWTGKIAVDPSGKWIKGPNYRAPDLYSVLIEEGRLKST